jgi:hypothetical protein
MISSLFAERVITRNEITALFADFERKSGSTPETIIVEAGGLRETCKETDGMFTEHAGNYNDTWPRVISRKDWTSVVE